MELIWQILLVSLAVAMVLQCVLVLGLFHFFGILDRRLRRAEATPHARPTLAAQDIQPAEKRLHGLMRRTAATEHGDCATCTGLCCRYLAVPLDTPTEPEDYDWVRYALSHRGVLVYVEDDEWFLEIGVPCDHLAEDHGCGIYATRPKICREYSTEGCEQTARSLRDFEWESYWTSVTAFEQWLEDELNDQWTEYRAAQDRLNSSHPSTGNNCNGSDEAAPRLVGLTIRHDSPDPPSRIES